MDTIISDGIMWEKNLLVFNRATAGGIKVRARALQ